MASEVTPSLIGGSVESHTVTVPSELPEMMYRPDLHRREREQFLSVSVFLLNLWLVCSEHGILKPRSLYEYLLIFVFF